MKNIFLISLPRFIVFSFFLFAFSDLYSAEFYRLQSGSTTITGLSTTVNIDYVCKNQSFLVFSTTVSNNEPRDCQVGGEITNETTLTFEKETGGGSTVEIRWQVFEFSDGVTVQHGSDNVNGTQNIPITNIDLSKSFVIFSGKKDGTTFGNDDFVRSNLTSTTNLQLRVTGGQHTEVFWQVIQYDSAFVQRIATSLVNGQTTISSAIPVPVDSTKTLIISSHRAGGNVNSDDLPRVELENSSSLLFEREGNAQTLNILTFVIEFTDGTTIAHGIDSFATAETTRNISISPITNSTGVIGTGHLGKQGSTTFNSDDDPGHNWFTFEFSSETNLRIERAVGTGSTAKAPYQIITFNDPSNTTFYSRTSGAWDDNNSWSYFSDGSSGPVPAGVWPSRNDNVVIRNGDTITVDAVNDNQICGLSPDDLNRSNIGAFTSSDQDMFYQTGDIIVDAGGRLNFTVRSMFEGFTYINGTLSSTQDIVNIGNLEATSTGVLNTSDDLVLSGNSLTILNNTSTSSDDLYIDHTDALLCGDGILNVGNGGADPEIQYFNGATSAQVCSYLTVTCTINCGGAPFVAPPNPGNFSLGYIGLGGVGNTNDNKLWLKADDLNQADASSVTLWPDTSGNGLTAVANTPLNTANQPVINLNAVNGFPSLGFDGGDLLNLGNSDLDFIPQTDEWSFFIAYNVSNGDDGTFLSKARNPSGQRQYHYFTNSNQLDGVAGGTSNNGSSTSATGAWTIASTIIEANSTGFNSYLNSTSEISNGGVGTATLATTDVLIGARRINASTSTFAQELTGEISEIGMYNQSVNEAQRIIIENYLSAKYDNSLTSNDLYDEDNNANGDYDFEVAGIGQASDGSFQKDSKGQGLVRMSLPKDIDNNEFLIWGHDGTAISEVNMTDVDGIIIQARLNRIWRLSESDVAGTAVNIGTVRLTFDARDLPPSILGSDIRLLITRDDALFIDNDVQPQPGSYNIDNQLITFSNVDFRDGDRFTLGTIDNTRSPLPIELSSFEANRVEDKVNLTWITVREKNNDFFTIERSTNTKVWESLGTIEGAKDSDSQQFYNYLDPKPNEGFNYYRIKQTDLDGNFSLSQIRSVYFITNDVENFNVFPNPNRGEFQITSQNQKIKHLRIYDYLGIDLNFQSEIIDGNAIIRMNDLTPGIYFIQVNAQTVRLIIY